MGVSATQPLRSIWSWDRIAIVLFINTIAITKGLAIVIKPLCNQYCLGVNFWRLQDSGIMHIFDPSCEQSWCRVVYPTCFDLGGATGTSKRTRIEPPRKWVSCTLPTLQKFLQKFLQIPNSFKKCSKFPMLSCNKTCNFPSFIRISRKSENQRFFVILMET